MTHDLTIILQENLKVAVRMLGHLERSRTQIEGDLPLKAIQIRELRDEQIDRLDLFLGRFGKLQEFLVSKLFRSIAVSSLEDTSQDVSLLDNLRRMEKYGIIHSLDNWYEIRLLRNSLTHEYLTDDSAISENINAAFVAFDILKATLERAKDYCRHHIFRDDEF